jgi:ribosomal protein S18 acetylase RimI-like enzyme
MISTVDHHDPVIAEQIYQLQQAAYKVERDLIAYQDFPPLRVTVSDIQQEPDTFLGYWEAGELAGVLSFTVTPTLVDIGRLIVHPAHFRQGIASRLLRSVERYATAGRQLTVSTAEKNSPAVSLYEKHGYQGTQRTTLPDGLVLVRFFKTLQRYDNGSGG